MTRSPWTDPPTTLRTLQSFAETEEDGGKDLAAAARRIVDPELRGHVERHAEDEVRHARLFRERAAELAAEHSAGRHGGERSDRAYDLARKRGDVELDSHGFFSAGLYDELGEVAYVAMLHVAEQRAAELFAKFRDQTAHDPRTRAVFEEILKDEKYHVAYTGRILDKWRAAGREDEVDKALKLAKGSRLIGAWKRLGVRSAATFGRAVMFVCYWTLLLPFGIVASLRSGDGAGRRGWQSSGDSEADLRTQY